MNLQNMEDSSMDVTAFHLIIINYIIIDLCTGPANMQI